MPAATATRTLTLTASADHLAAQIGWVADRLPTRPPIPVLAGMLLEITGDRATATATDYDVWAQATLDADVEGEGRAVLPGAMLAALLSKLPRGRMVTLTIEGARMHVRCGTVRATLPTLPLEDYPTVPAWPAEVGRVEAADLARALGRVAPAVATDPALPMLTGIHIAPADEGLVLTASDRYCLARDTVAWEPVLEATPLGELLVPGEVLARAGRSLTGTVAVGAGADTYGGALLGLADATRRLSLRLLNEDYVKATSHYEQAMAQMALTVTMATADLLEALDRASVFASGETPVRLTVDTDHLLVHGGTDGEDADERVPATTDGPVGVRVAFQIRRLRTGLTALRTDTVRLHIGHPHRPVVATCADADDPSWWLTMPVRQ